MRRNVIGISFTFFFRIIYDFLRVAFGDKFIQMREKSYREDSLDYPVFFFVVILTCDFLPSLMFISNLRYIWSKEIIISKNIVEKTKRKRKVSLWSFKPAFERKKGKEEDEYRLENDEESFHRKSDSLICSYD